MYGNMLTSRYLTLHKNTDKRRKKKTYSRMSYQSSMKRKYCQIIVWIIHPEKEGERTIKWDWGG